ncbi:MAG: Crp/Fnr family transcriptional regulator [Desulforhopalus sp.]
MSSNSDTSDGLAPKNNEQIVKELFYKIKVSAEAGDFEVAERLRDELIDTNPMAIGEAIKSAELIEKEMSAAINKDHLAIFSDLYELLALEERNCLFHSLKKYEIPEKKILLKYGSLNHRLFFIEKGRVNIGVPGESGKPRVIAQLGQGHILGEYSFATIALCSATAITKTDVQLRCLENKNTEKWEKKHPGLLNKILEYCHKHGSLDQIEARKEREEHIYQRHQVNGHVKAFLLDGNLKKTDITFNGELEEISRSGTSFSIRCNKKATVKQLLTRTFLLDFTCGKKGNELRFQHKGKVVHVSPLLYNDYVLHIGFHTTLAESLDMKLAP